MSGMKGRDVSPEERRKNIEMDRMCSYCGGFADVVMYPYVKLCSNCYEGGNEENRSQRFMRDVLNYYNDWQDVNGELSKDEIIKVLSRWLWAEVKE